MRFRKITIIGVGLLGGSIGLAVKRRSPATRVTGFVRRKAGVRECLNAGAVDVAVTDLAAAVAGADLVVLCTPLAQMQALAREIVPALKRGAVVTDVGSVKASVVREVESLVQKAGGCFVGSHPMAGAEKNGVAAARANLFEQTVCILTPTARTSQAALKKVEHFWKQIGSRVIKMRPELHDALVSRSSHLPHLIAAALANYVLKPEPSRLQATLCATGFRDTTRIASGSPEMWRDIALSNRRHLSRSLADYISDLQEILRWVKSGDAQRLMRFFETAKNRRDGWCSGCTSPSPE